MRKTSVSIVLPAFNEEVIIEHTVATVVQEMRAKEIPFELIISENGSEDDTREIADDLAGMFAEVKATTSDEADYGAALRQGFRASQNDIVVNFDCDYYNIDFLEAAVAKFDADKSIAIVVGSKRAIGATDTRAWHRRLVTAVFSGLLRKVFGLHRSDTHGMKAMRRELVAPYVDRCRLTSDLFDTELILRTERAGLATDEIPVAVMEQRPARSSIVRRIPRTILGLFRLYFVLRTIPILNAATEPRAEAA